MTYNTGNPVPSRDPRDLIDNAESFDIRVTSRSVRSTPDRLGVPRNTWHGMEQDFAEFLAASGYQFLGEYAPGIQVTAYNQVVRSGGEFWRAAADTSLPYVTTGSGIPEGGAFVSVGDATLRQDLAIGASALVDSKAVEHKGTPLPDILDLELFAWVHKHGAKLDGVTDDGPAIRLALDEIPSTGGELHFPEGSQVKVVGTIFIPQRIPAVGVEGKGVRLIGNNSQIIGDGSSVIFESGSGQYSTVALGGATNWDQPDEGAGTIHYNSAIIGFNFKSCSTPIRLKNWLHGCVLEKLYATDFTGRMIWTDRCFYMAQRDIQGRPFRDDRADDMPIFQYVDTNNTMTFDSVHGSGISPSGISKGIVFEFDQGVQGVELPAGCSAEGAKIGLHLKSIVYSMAVTGVYFELCDRAIKSSAANLNNLVIDYCEFEDNLIDIDVDNWIDGYFGSANKNEGQVIFGSGCTHTVHLPSQALTDLNHESWVSAPPGWTIPGGCQVMRNDMIFNSAVGAHAIWFRNAAASSGGTGVVPLAYSGECFNVGNVIPYCEASVTPGTLTVDTKIRFNQNMSAVRFDINVLHSQSDVVSGVLTCGVIRLDAGNPAGVTVTASDNGLGFLRLVFAGFSLNEITGYSGKIRVI